MMENYSLSDIRAATGGENGFGGMGGDSLIWLVVLFLFFGGNGFNGNRGFGDAATAAAQNEILLGQQFGTVNDKLNSIGNGICDSTYAITNAITAEGRATQTAISALASKIDANEIQNLRDKVTELSLASSQCRQNEYLINQLKPPCPVPAYITCSPYQTFGGCCTSGYQPNI